MPSFLAAGASQRFGADNKLLTDIGGKPLIRLVAEETAHSGAEVVVVTGCDYLIQRPLKVYRFGSLTTWIGRQA